MFYKIKELYTPLSYRLNIQIRTWDYFNMANEQEDKITLHGLVLYHNWYHYAPTPTCGWPIRPLYFPSAQLLEIIEQRKGSVNMNCNPYNDSPIDIERLIEETDMHDLKMKVLWELLTMMHYES